jgi:hypothetical protein
MTLATRTELLTESEARSLTANILHGLQNVWTLIETAYTGRAWLALGYSSWDDYCESEFQAARIKLPREERAVVVASMRASGMSTRAIASATGLSQKTASRITRESNDSPVVGTDGKTYNPRPKTEYDEIREADTTLWERAPYSRSADPTAVIDAEIVDEDSAGLYAIIPVEKNMIRALDKYRELGLSSSGRAKQAVIEMLEQNITNIQTMIERIREND